MIVAALLALAPISTAIDAEAAFARDAQRHGQWTAFRKWADPDAVMFTPHAVWARSFLKPLKDPPRSITWRATQSYSSCDRRTAVDLGPWFTQDHHLAGYFTTVWQRSKTGWRWVYDGGIPASQGSLKPLSVEASCTPASREPPIAASSGLQAKEPRASPEDSGRGMSADRTLSWDWKVTASGERTFRVYLWNGRRFAEVMHTVDPAPQPK